jgi:Flp pilus assembly protein TadG
MTQLHLAVNLRRRRRTGPRLGRLLRDGAGAAAITLAISLSALAGFAGLGTEVASWYLAKRTMQGAADTAAATAASALAAGASKAALTQEAQSIAASYKFIDGVAGASVTVNYPPQSGNYQSSPAIEVIVKQPKKPLLSGLFLAVGPTISARAVALADTSKSGQGCVVSLDRQSIAGITASGSSTQLNLLGCSLYDDAAGGDAINFNGGATINAANAYLVGTVSGSGLTTTYGTYTGVNPLLDPYLNAAVPNYATTGCVHNYNLNSGSTATKSPDATGIMVFCNGLQITGNATLNLCTGTYVIAGGSLSVGGGSTLAAGSNGKCATASINGGANVTIVAPISGALSGIALFQDRACTDASQNNTLNGGASQNITGAIYFPGEAVSYSGGAPTGGAICTQLIADTITFSGAATFNNNCTGTGTRSVCFTGGRLVE